MSGEQRRLQFMAQPKEASILPAEYLALSCIQGENGRWGYTIPSKLSNASLCIECDLEIVEWNTNSNNCLFGSTMVGYGALGVVTTTTEPICVMHQGKGLSSVTFNTLSKGRHVYSMYYTHLDIDGEVVANYNYGYTIVTLNIFGSEWNVCPLMRVHHIVVRVGDDIKHDLYPCVRLSDNKIGFYDTISNSFSVRPTTGNFTGIT